MSARSSSLTPQCLAGEKCHQLGFLFHRALISLSLTCRYLFAVHQSPYASSPYHQGMATSAPSVPPSNNATATLSQQHPSFRPPPHAAGPAPLTPQSNPGAASRPRHLSGPPPSQPPQPQARPQPPPQPQATPTSATPPTKPTPPAGPPRTLTQPPPLAPEAKSREKERISLLLVINGELLQEVIRLRSEGKSGAPLPSPQNDSKGPQASDESLADASRKSPPHPDYME